MQRRTGVRTRGVVLLGAVLRMIVVGVLALRYPHDWLFARGMEMGLLGRSLVEGHGLSSPFGPETGPTAFIAPGYPLLVAGIFKVFGVYSFASAVVVMLLQTGVAALTLWLMMRVADRLSGGTAAKVAGLIWAVGLPLLWVPTIFWDTSLAIAAVTGMAALALEVRDSPQGWHWAGLGAYCAVVGLMNPALLPTLVAMVGWAAWQVRRQLWRNVLVAGLVFAALFAAWPVRNAMVFHAFIPTRTTVGYELWMGNRPGASGYLDEDQFPSFNAGELADYVMRGEVGYTDHKAALARAYVRERPGVFVRMTARRVWRFWSGTGSKGGSGVFAAYAVLTTVFGLGGLWLLMRRRRFDVAVLFALPCVLFPLPYYITHAEFRYRLVLDPLLTVLAGYALVEAGRAFAAAGRARSAAVEEALSA